MAKCVHIMQQVFDKYLASAPKSFNLQPYKADKYFGLLLDDNTADWFKNMLCEFAHEVSKLGMHYLYTPMLNRLSSNVVNLIIRTHLAGPNQGFI